MLTLYWASGVGAWWSCDPSWKAHRHSKLEQRGPARSGVQELATRELEACAHEGLLQGPEQTHREARTDVHLAQEPSACASEERAGGGGFPKLSPRRAHHPQAGLAL